MRYTTGHMTETAEKPIKPAKMQVKSFAFLRHSERSTKDANVINSDAPGYPGITERGVQMLEEPSARLALAIEAGAPNAVVFIGGSSEEIRTRSSAEVIGDNLARMYKDDPNTVVITRSQIKEMYKAQTSPEADPQMAAVDRMLNVIKHVKTIIHDNPDKRIIVTYPLHLKQFSMRPILRDFQGNQTAYTKELEARNPGDVDAQMLEAMLDTHPADYKNPRPFSPDELGNQHLQGVERLHRLAERVVGERETFVAFVGHGLYLDTLAGKLAKRKDESLEKAYRERLQAKSIGQAEMGIVRFKDNAATFTYQGQTHPVDISQISRAA